MKFKIGDTVKVKDGTIDPDFGVDISGWYGQIIDTDDELVFIELDSITLSNIPDEYFTKCEEEGFDSERIYLASNDVELAIRRDTEKDLLEIQNQIDLNHQWDYLGGSGKIVSQVLTNVDQDDHSKAFNAWEEYLNENLSFPFDAEISEYQNKGPLKQGDKIRIHGILESDDLYGVLVRLRLGRKGYHFPLSDIEPTNKTSLNSQLLNAYRDWFVNR